MSSQLEGLKSLQMLTAFSPAATLKRIFDTSSPMVD